MNVAVRSAGVDAVHQLVRAAAGAARDGADVDAGACRICFKVQFHGDVGRDISDCGTIVGVASHNGHILQASCCSDLAGQRTGEVDVFHRAAIQRGEQAAKLCVFAPSGAQVKFHSDRLVLTVERALEIGDAVEGFVLIVQIDVGFQHVGRILQQGAVAVRGRQAEALKVGRLVAASEDARERVDIAGLVDLKRGAFNFGVVRPVCGDFCALANWPTG